MVFLITTANISTFPNINRFHETFYFNKKNTIPKNTNRKLLPFVKKLLYLPLGSVVRIDTICLYHNALW